MRLFRKRYPDNMTDEELEEAFEDAITNETLSDRISLAWQRLKCLFGFHSPYC